MEEDLLISNNIRLVISRSAMERHSTVPVTSMDFYPTLLEMVGLPPQPEQHIDGVSLVPLFNDGSIERDTFFWHFPHYQGEGSYPSSAIRKNSYKLIYSYQHDDVVLYDLVKDPGETTDLTSSFPKVAEELKSELINYLKKIGAHIPKPVSELKSHR